MEDFGLTLNKLNLHFNLVGTSCQKDVFADVTNSAAQLLYVSLLYGNCVHFTLWVSQLLLTSNL